jgi:predicted alpha/beta-fold hydrolase
MAVDLYYPREGGHVGFLRGAPPGRLDWLAERLFTHFNLATGGLIAAR